MPRRATRRSKAARGSWVLASLVLAAGALGCGVAGPWSAGLVCPAAGGRVPVTAPEFPVARALGAATGEYGDGEGVAGWSYASLRAAPVGVFGRTGIDADFELEEPGIEFSMGCMGPTGLEDTMFLSVAVARFRDPGSGMSGTGTCVDLGPGQYFPKGYRETRRSAISLGAGLSLFSINLDGRDRDAVGMGLAGRAGLLFWISRNWELELGARVHAWLGMDDREFLLAGDASLGLSLVFCRPYEE